MILYNDLLHVEKKPSEKWSPGLFPVASTWLCAAGSVRKASCLSFISSRSSQTQ